MRNSHFCQISENFFYSKKTRLSGSVYLYSFVSYNLPSLSLIALMIPDIRNGFFNNSCFSRSLHMILPGGGTGTIPRFLLAFLRRYVERSIALPVAAPANAVVAMPFIVSGAANAATHPVALAPANNAPVSAAFPAIFASFIFLIGFLYCTDSAWIYPNSPSSSITYTLPVIGSFTQKLLRDILVFFLILFISDSYTFPQISLSTPSKIRIFPILFSRSFPSDLELIGFFSPAPLIVKIFFLNDMLTCFPFAHVTLVSKSNFVVVLRFSNFLIGLVKNDVGRFVFVLHFFSVDKVYCLCN